MLPNANPSCLLHYVPYCCCTCWKSLLPCCHKGRKVGYFPFTTGFSQGNASETLFSSLTLLFGLLQFSNIDVQAYRIMIMDGVTILGLAWYSNEKVPSYYKIDPLPLQEVEMPAFYAAHVCHLGTLIQDRLCSFLISTKHSSLVCIFRNIQQSCG